MESGFDRRTAASQHGLLLSEQRALHEKCQTAACQPSGTYYRRAHRKDTGSPTPLHEPDAQLNYKPLKSTPSNSSEGMRHDEDRRGSFPTAANDCHRVSILPVTFISLTGCTIRPSSTRKPSMPYEKSPVVLLQFPPLKPVTRMPFPTPANSSSKLFSPGAITNTDGELMVGGTPIFSNCKYQ